MGRGGGGPRPPWPPPGSAHGFTYVSDSWHTVSWLDHCICTADADEIIANIDILYDCATTDHIPFHVVCDIDCLPVLSNETNN